MDEPNVAVVGCGYWGKNLVRNFREIGSLSQVCDADAEGRERAKDLAPAVGVTADFDEVLAGPAPAVVIATPAPTHFDLTRRALNAGKDVLVEKPLALRYDEGAELLEHARATDQILMVGHVLEYHPAVVRLKELVDDGELGDVHYVYSNRLNLGKIRREENILWSFAPHDIAVMLRLVGQLPFQVSATGGSYVQPNIPDTTVTHLLFDDGVRGHIYVSWLHPFKEQRLVVIGSRRMAAFDDVSKELVLYDQRVEVGEDGPVPIEADQGRAVDFPDDEPLRRECEAFLEAVRTRDPPLADGQSGLDVLKVLEAAQRSLTTNGVAVNLPFEAARVTPAGSSDKDYG
jgi:predicted dehydrogenase